MGSFVSSRWCGRPLGAEFRRSASSLQSAQHREDGENVNDAKCVTPHGFYGRAKAFLPEKSSFSTQAAQNLRRTLIHTRPPRCGATRVGKSRPWGGRPCARMTKWNVGRIGLTWDSLDRAGAKGDAHLIAGQSLLMLLIGSKENRSGLGGWSIPWNVIVEGTIV